MSDHGQGNVLIYRDASTALQVRLDGATVWLSQRQIAELYGVSVKTVSEHLLNVQSEGELEPLSTVRKFRTVQTEGTREVTHVADCAESLEQSSDFDRAVRHLKELS